MKWKLLLALSALLLLASVPARAQDEVSDLLSRINNLRASVGRSPYSLNGALSAAAQSQAQWIVDTGTVSHTRPDGSGPRTRALNAGYPSADVSENIYGGTNATVNNAWTFWVNSGVHYSGLVNPRYDQVGIGIARGSWGAAFVLVFGNSGGSPPPPPASAGSGNAGASGSGNNSARSGPPAYFVGVDAAGNIMHEVQPGDTLGDIALIYGYTWDDIPAMMALNGITDVRDLDVGTIFLVPPKAGTYTPTPGGPTATFTPSPTARPPTITPYIYQTEVTFPTVVAVAPPGATAAALIVAQVVTVPPAMITTSPFLLESPTPASSPSPQPIAAATAVALAATPEEVNAVTAPPQGRNNTSTWIIIAVLVQALVVVFAGVEFLRRRGRP